MLNYENDGGNINILNELVLNNFSVTTVWSLSGNSHRILKVKNLNKITVDKAALFGTVSFPSGFKFLEYKNIDNASVNSNKVVSLSDITFYG